MLNKATTRQVLRFIAHGAFVITLDQARKVAAQLEGALDPAQDPTRPISLIIDTMGGFRILPLKDSEVAAHQ